MTTDAATADLEQLARQCRDSGDWRPAIEPSRARLRQLPNDVAALRLLSEALLRSGDFARLAADLQPYVARGAAGALLLFRYGVARAQLGDTAAAVEAYQRAVQKRPGFGEAWLNLGSALKDLGRLEEAAEASRQAVALRPALPQAHNNLGNMLQRLGRHDEALAALDQALRLRPSYARAHANRAKSLQLLDRFDEAEAAARQAIASDPALLDGWSALGKALKAAGRLAEAEAALQEARRLGPPEASTLLELSLTLRELGRIEEALAIQCEHLALDPANDNGALNEAFLLLTLGDFAAGWARYERRWGTGDFLTSRRPFAAPRWSGEALGRRTLLLSLEQGLGDCVQFARYLPLLARRHPEATLLYEVQEAAVALMQHSFRALPQIAVFPHVNKAGRNLPSFDLHLPFASLPSVCGTRLDSVPGAVPYLAAPAHRDYRQAGDRLAIGISWQSRSRSGRKRNLALDRLARMLARPGVRLIDLQYGDTAGERQALAAAGIALHHDDAVDPSADLAAFAGQVAGCDLVVSIDNTTVHVAGALAVPCWALLPWVADWRWMLRREDTPWYPTLKLYRQPALDAWDPVLDRVGADFAALLAGDRSVLAARPWQGPPASSP